MYVLNRKNKEEAKAMGPALLPGNKMRLMDGREIDIFPRKQVMEGIDNSLRLDTSGEFLSFHRNSKQLLTMPEAPSEKEGLQFFLDNVFFFVAHCEEILSDSRMFLAQVPVRNGMAYTGTSGFRYPTLGVYLEWWMNNGQTIVKDADSKLLIYWFVSGSPLSGSNACAVVNERGEHTTRRVSYFPIYWRTFMGINTRYDECKAFGEAYNLEQVKEKLTGKEHGNYIEKSYINAYSWMTDRLIKERDEARQSYSDAYTRIKYLKMDQHEEALLQILADYHEQVKKNNEEIAHIKEQKREAKKKLKRGEITNKEYQQYITPLKERLFKLE